MVEVSADSIELLDTSQMPHFLSFRDVHLNDPVWEVYFGQWWQQVKKTSFKQSCRTDSFKVSASSPLLK